MNCQDALDRVHLYTDGELDALAGRGVEDHLLTCLACKQAYQLHTDLSDAVRTKARRYAARPISCTNPFGLRRGPRQLREIAYSAVGLARCGGFPRGGPDDGVESRFPGAWRAGRRTAADRRSGCQPHTLSHGEPSHRRGLERPTHREALVRREGGFCAAGRGSHRARLPAGRRKIGVPGRPRRRGTRVPAPITSDQRLYLARAGGKGLFQPCHRASGLQRDPLHAFEHGLLGGVGCEPDRTGAVYASVVKLRHYQGGGADRGTGGIGNRPGPPALHAALSAGPRRPESPDRRPERISARSPPPAAYSEVGKKSSRAARERGARSAATRRIKQIGEERKAGHLRPNGRTAIRHVRGTPQRGGVQGGTP